MFFCLSNAYMQHICVFFPQYRRCFSANMSPGMGKKRDGKEEKWDFLARNPSFGRGGTHYFCLFAGAGQPDFF